MKRAVSVAVLGLDALPYWVLPRIAERGLAPSVLGEKQVQASLRLEAIPPITPASWPSIMSGVNPGKHGLFSFFHYDRETHEQRLVTALDLEHPRIHEMLSYEGVESFVLNPIPDFPLLPARKAKVIANLFFSPDPVSRPRDLVEKYFNGLPWPPKRSPGYYLEYLERLEVLVEEVAPEKPPLLWLNVNFPDALYHKYPETIAKPWKLSRHWRVIDRIGRKLRGEMDAVIVVSDHGFRVFRYRVNVNDILAEHGYVERSREETEVVTEEELQKSKRAKTQRINVPTWLYRLVGRLGLEPLARKVFFNYFRPLYQKLTGRTLVVRSGASIDHGRSRACMPYGGAYGVYVKDRAILGEVYNLLRGVEGLRVWMAEEVYNGPYRGRGPDIVLVGDHEKGYALGPARLMGEAYTRTDYPGHDMWGVLVPVQGLETLNLPPGETVPNHIVAPMVQCLLGLPVSHTVDGMGLLERICGGKLETRNYVGRFRVAKRIAARMAARLPAGGNK